MQLPNAPHSRYDEIAIADHSLDYNPENPNEYVLFKPVQKW